MTVRKMIVIVCSLSAVGAVIGGLLGLLFGILLPDFYVATLPGPVNPIQVGLGFGIAQGLMMGFILGIVVIVVAAWRDRGRPS